MTEWPLVPFGEVLTKSDECVTLNPLDLYKQVTVRMWGQGVVERNTVTGQQIGSASRLLVRTNQFLLSRIDARNGASGLVPALLDGAVVSNDFPAFNVKTDRLDPRFLGWYAKTARFVEDCKAASEGTTNRVRLKEDAFYAITMPLPPMEEQRRIVGRIERLGKHVKAAGALRMQVITETRQLLISLAHRMDLTNDEKYGGGWREILLGEVLQRVDEPHPVQSDREYPNLGIYSFGRGLFPKSPISGLSTSASTLFRVHCGQFVYSRLFAFEGAYGIVEPEFDGCFVSNEYPVFRCDPDLATPEFIGAYFRAPHVWKLAAENSKGLGDRRQRVQPEQILRMRIMVPPMTHQTVVASVTARLRSLEQGHDPLSIKHEMLLPSILHRAFSGGL